MTGPGLPRQNCLNKLRTQGNGLFLSISASIEHSRNAMKRSREAMELVREAMAQSADGMEAFNQAVTRTGEAVASTREAITCVGDVIAWLALVTTE